MLLSCKVFPICPAKLQLFGELGKYFFDKVYFLLFLGLWHRRFSPSRPFPNKGHCYSRGRPTYSCQFSTVVYYYTAVCTSFFAWVLTSIRASVAPPVLGNFSFSCKKTCTYQKLAVLLHPISYSYNYGWFAGDCSVIHEIFAGHHQDNKLIAI